MSKRKVALNEIVGRMSDPRAEGRKPQAPLNENRVGKLMRMMSDIEVTARQAKENLKSFMSGQERAGNQFKRRFNDLADQVETAGRTLDYLANVEGEL